MSSNIRTKVVVAIDSALMGPLAEQIEDTELVRELATKKAMIRFRGLGANSNPSDERLAAIAIDAIEGVLFDLEFASRARMARAKSGFDLTAGARALGTTTPTLSMVEKGRREAKSRLVDKMCDTYGVSADWLLGRTSNFA